jgi:hypothetical protein
MTATRRQQAGQLGGLVTRSRYDGQTITAAARAGQAARFARQVDALAAERGETLSPRERARRIEAARLAHMAKMRLARKPKAVGR